jgi:hypothetical protein
VSTSKKETGSEITKQDHVKGRPQSREDAEIEDLEYAIKLLKIKVHAATNVLEKLRHYNQIKSLEGSIDRLRSKGSPQ